MAPTAGSLPSAVTKHLGIVLLVVQLDSLPHIHVPSVGVFTFPEAVHVVPVDISHMSVPAAAQTHSAVLPEPEHIGFNALHPRWGALALKSLSWRFACFLVHGTHCP